MVNLSALQGKVSAIKALIVECQGVAKIILQAHKNLMRMFL
jgi:hypothetical protein